MQGQTQPKVSTVRGGG